MGDVLTEVTGDLFVGEAKLFFSNPRRVHRRPFRLETSSRGDERLQGPLALRLRVSNADMIVLHDSRLDGTRIENTLLATDVAAENAVRAYETGNSGRWANLSETSDGRHWSEGEYILRRGTRSISDTELDKCDRARREEDEALGRLISRVPTSAHEAVRDGRAIVISRDDSLWNCISGAGNTNGKRPHRDSYDLVTYRFCKIFGNDVYALCRVERGNSDRRGRTTDDVTAIMIVGRFWPARKNSRGDVGRRPLLTVVRRRGEDRTTGGRVVCVCLGTHLKGTLDGMSAEEIAKTRRHYEGYVSEAEYERCLKR